jgi:hypothetical protein
MAAVLRWLIEHFREEYRVIKGAPVTLLTSIVIAGAVVFGISEWHHSGSESALRSINEMLREELKGASPQLAALQSRRIRERDNLLRLYAEAGPLLRREIPHISQHNMAPEPEAAKRFIADTQQWSMATSEWLRQNLGETARERFIDTGSSGPPASFNYSFDSEVNRAYNTTMILRRNLALIIETAAYDK